mmetsp:Transcript_13732/g.22725  ORF Transcript_13732/g.22725 Transcript_13732/m.22725 type:complete len:312 (-) Transcript_13732:210-1145(-)|eukprot:CAMPEP_0119014732 /NCGR_PEP_ID=MMETSP1176-20130426/10305_1 /TAXON_ID=265551 /ORGANISM="Synedropsis recta cf, Strain CCMP1620" /LENGTH=311 /DNA_ID=CAMNT_0006967965 /DNA_START=90 /DNA_END=1025 /DNA_ORIENTATION=+
MISKSYSALVLSLLVAGASAFAPQPFGGSALLKHSAPAIQNQALFMADKEAAVATKSAEDDCQPEEGEYCLLDERSGKLIKLTVEEKERIFLDALQSYYATGRQILPDDEWDLLKEDLQWSGSEVVSLNRQEAKYLAAMEAFQKGTPSPLSDVEFDELKQELKDAGSKFAVSTQPKCLIDTGVCTVTMQEDQFRSNLLYVPALAILFSVWLGPVFEILAFTTIRLNPLFFTIVGAYPIYLISKFITEELLFPKKFIVYGPCPSCEVENRVYFGNILGVEGFSDTSSSKCANCKTEFKVQRSTLRASTLPKA